MSANQATLVLVKPDGLKKSLTGNILTRLSETKLEIVAAKIVRVSKELAVEHYAHLKNQPFFDELITYLMGELHDRKKVMAVVYWGEDAINKVRKLAGATNPEEADPVSIRGAYGRITTKGVYENYGRITTKGVYENVIHASSNEAEAKREIQLWFQPQDIIVDLYPAQEVAEKEVLRKVWVN